MVKYDVVVIGGGPGGYVAAVKASRLGKKTACIEKYETLGGVCLNVGCIPSKALLDSSEYYHLAKNGFAEHGIHAKEITLDLAAMMKRKNKVVADLTGQVKQLLQRNKVDIFHGTATLQAPGKIFMSSKEGKSQSIDADAVILATGSVPTDLPGMAFDGERIITSTDALRLKAVPKRLGIVGGGAVGLELGSIWHRLGSAVTVIEMLPKIGAGLDGQVGRTLERLLKRRGMKIFTKTEVTNARANEKDVQVTVEGKKGEQKLTFDHLLVSVGRRPKTDELGLENLGVNIDSKTGWIPVDENYQTSVPGIYAVGDLIAGPMLAHKAMAEGIAAAECIAGKPGEVNYDTVPSIIYTQPEVAAVGLTEETARERKIPCCIGTFPFVGVGRARCMGEKDGLVKIISHAKTDRVLGVHIIGPRASDLIAECSLAISFGAGSEDIARTVHGHPTFSEALQEAAMVARKCSVYI